MKRILCALTGGLLAVLNVSHAWPWDIPTEDVNLTPPCTLSLTPNGSLRTLSWSTVTGATLYKLGYRLGDGPVEGIAQVTNTTFDHEEWNPDDCMEYVLVAYDGTGTPICAAHVENVGLTCPER